MVGCCILRRNKQRRWNKIRIYYNIEKIYVQIKSQWKNNLYYQSRSQIQSKVQEWIIGCAQKEPLMLILKFIKTINLKVIQIANSQVWQQPEMFIQQQVGVRGMYVFQPMFIYFKKKEGLIQMKDLQIGDQIKTKEGKFAKVTIFLHYQPQQFMECLKISNGTYQFLISPMHCIADQKQVYSFAKDMENKIVYGSFGKIVKISDEIKKGIYAPLTETGNYLVFTNDKKEHILAHCLGHTNNPELSLIIVNKIIKTYELLYQNPKSGEHPVGTWLREKLGIFAE